MNEAPSRSRSRLDAIYAALPTDTDAPLAAIVETSGVDRDVVRSALAAAKAGKVASGQNGRWSRALWSRTWFRDQTVLGALIAAAKPLTFAEVLQVVPVSAPQLYTTLARLQVAGRVTVVRDGSRTPRYLPAGAN